MKVVITGSRDWTDEFIIDAVIEGLLQKARSYNEPLIIAHGHNPKGADAIADQWTGVPGVEVRRYPAAWITHGKAAGPLRNQEMLDNEKPDLVVGFIDQRYACRGTRDCLTRAKLGKYKTMMVMINA